MEFNYGKINNFFNVLEKNYQTRGEIEWYEFDKNQSKNSRKVVLVRQEDFKYGTLRVKEPCMIKLVENIYFNPNRPNTWLDNDGNITLDFNNASSIDPNRKLDWWPDFQLEENKKYFAKEVRNAYRLGFFAAMTLENEEIILNLNGKIIQQHPEHALQQRFFSVIELADQPFIPKQGPANFGSDIKSAKKCAIINGKIGLSSHHGIHGNSNITIMIKNVDFIENEVASIALNGSNESYIVNVNIIKNRHDIPVLGTYSAGRFIKLFTLQLKNGIDKVSSNYLQYIDNLNKDLDATFNSVILRNGNVPNFYKNESGLIDGNYYGIIINPTGIAVFAPLENRKTPKANETNSIYMKCISINNIKTNINEIITLQNNQGKIMTAPSGAVFDIMKVNKIVDGKYYYNGNSLSDLQIELYEILKLNPNIKSFLGNFNFDEGLLIWKNNKDSYFIHSDNKFIGNNGLENFYYNAIGNGDSMFHVNKGTFGLKIDGLNTSFIDNITISNMETISGIGSTLAGNYRKSHPKQNHLEGYQGHNIYGINLNASNDVTLENITLSDIKSVNGSAHGFHVDAESIKISLVDSKIENIVSSQNIFNPKRDIWPNLMSHARGIFVNTNCDVGLKNINMKNIIDTPNCINKSDCEFLSIIRNI